MPNSLRKTLDHFTLQLQLVIATATRVRRALEEGDPVQIARVNEDADAGISQQILVQAIVAAGKDVGEIHQVQSSWKSCAEGQVKRMLHCAEEAENAKHQLNALSAQMGSFGGDQKEKSKSVLSTMISNQNTALLQTIFSAWLGNYVKYKAEQHIHEKFQRQIEDLKMKLIDFKQSNKSNTKGVLMKHTMRRNHSYLQDHFMMWKVRIQSDIENRGLQDQLAAAQERLKTFKTSQQENSKKVITRMTADSDSTLQSMCFQAWVQYVVDYKKDKQFNDAVKASEQQLQMYMAKKSQEAKSMFTKMMGGCESGLIASAFKAWRDDFLADKEHRLHLESISASNIKYDDLSKKQKKAAKNICHRTNVFDEENFLAHCWHAWLTIAKHSNLIKHYSGKLNSKKAQLDAVQHMFKSFANQLEKGISSTPRSQQTMHRGAQAPHQHLQQGVAYPDQNPAAGRPPQLPS